MYLKQSENDGNPKRAWDALKAELDRRADVDAELLLTQWYGVEIRKGDFGFGLSGIGRKDFAYLDPPYYKLGGYSDFNRYTSTKFKEAQHIHLAALCWELDTRKVRWALSNSNTPFIRRLYKGFKIHRIPARREIQLDSRKRDVYELLITNY